MRRGGGGELPASRIAPPDTTSSRLVGITGRSADFPLSKEVPPLFSDRGRIAQVLLVHDLHEGGVVGAEDELAHGCNLIKWGAGFFLMLAPGQPASPRSEDTQFQDRVSSYALYRVCQPSCR